MLGVTVPDIHRSLDKAVQATMIPAARVRGIYIDAPRVAPARPRSMIAAAQLIDREASPEPLNKD